MSEHDIRMECLKLALLRDNGATAIDTARLYAGFVLGTDDANVIRAAREFAGQVTAKRN